MLKPPRTNSQTPQPLSKMRMVESLSRHDGSHRGCDACFAIKVKTISFTPSSMPSRHIGAVKTIALDKQRNKDLPAYERLVKSGAQPKATVGAAELESRATTKVEVNTGTIFGKEAPRAERANQEIRQAQREMERDVKKKMREDSR
jgi:hypothetical protein